MLLQGKMNTLLHDPEHFEAATFDQAVQKLFELNKISNHRDDWGKNIYLATKNLKDEYKEKFIRYLANPAGFKDNAKLCQEMEALEVSQLGPDHPTIDMDKLQRYTLKQTKNNEYTVVVENVEDDEQDDEKVDLNSNFPLPFDR